MEIPVEARARARRSCCAAQIGQLNEQIAGLDAQIKSQAERAHIRVKQRRLRASE